MRTALQTTTRGDHPVLSGGDDARRLRPDSGGNARAPLSASRRDSFPAALTAIVKHRTDRAIASPLRVQGRTAERHCEPEAKQGTGAGMRTKEARTSLDASCTVVANFEARGKPARAGDRKGRCGPDG